MSNDFDRRALLKGLGAAGALAAFQGFGSTAHAGPIRPGGWGRRPDHFGMTRDQNRCSFDSLRRRRHAPLMTPTSVVSGS
ncbi:MAG: twin-arginine translocation signal domain-containing protein [Myxococcota bacterium]